MAPIRDVWEVFVSRLRSSYNPGPNCTVDEMLTPFRGKCPFRQYVPSKPARYGIKIWWLCDSETFYPSNGQVYCGRRANEPREIGQSKRVVLDMTEPLFNSGRNICADNFFSSYELLMELKQHNISYVGTLRKNRKEIPEEFLKTRGRTTHSSLFGHCESATLVSYIPKPNKCVLLLLSTHFDQSVSSTPPFKPDIISDYNAQKCGVDVMDAMVGHFTTRRATRRWPVRLFMTMLDVGSLAGFVLYHTLFESVSRSKRGRFKYLLSVSHELMKTAMSARKLTRSIPQPARVIAEKEQMVVTNDSSSRTPQTAQRLQKRGRCYMCKQESALTKYSRRCDECQHFICQNHSQVACVCDFCKND